MTSFLSNSFPSSSVLTGAIATPTSSLLRHSSSPRTSFSQTLPSLIILTGLNLAGTYPVCTACPSWRAKPTAPSLCGLWQPQTYTVFVVCPPFLYPTQASSAESACYHHVMFWICYIRKLNFSPTTSSSSFFPSQHNHSPYHLTFKSNINCLFPHPLRLDNSHVLLILFLKLVLTPFLLHYHCPGPRTDSHSSSEHNLKGSLTYFPASCLFLFCSSISFVSLVEMWSTSETPLCPLRRKHTAWDGTENLSQFSVNVLYGVFWGGT